MCLRFQQTINYWFKNLFISLVWNKYVLKLVKNIWLLGAKFHFKEVFHASVYIGRYKGIFVGKVQSNILKGLCTECWKDWGIGPGLWSGASKAFLSNQRRLFPLRANQRRRADFSGLKPFHNRVYFYVSVYSPSRLSLHFALSVRQPLKFQNSWEISETHQSDSD